MANADFEAGMAAAKSKDYATALKEWRPLAEQGDARAQNQLGRMYINGIGVAQDDQQALKWLQLAALQGNADAQTSLGAMYWFGRSVPKDESEAVKWYRLAAEQGNVHAQSQLAGAYLVGRGVTANDQEALRWLRLAADQGNAQSQRQLGLMYAIGKVVEQDDAQAAKWLQLAADQGDTIAKSKLPLQPFEKAISDSVDKQYESNPQPDANSELEAVAMMITTLHIADHLKSTCSELDPKLQSDVELNLLKWKTGEEAAINKAQKKWDELSKTAPSLSSLALINTLPQLPFHDSANPGQKKIAQVYCRKYFADLASGIWRKRLPKVYAYLDAVP